MFLFSTTFFKLNYTYTYYYALIILKEIHKVLPYFKLHVKRKMKNKTSSEPLLYKHTNRVLKSVIQKSKWKEPHLSPAKQLDDLKGIFDASFQLHVCLFLIPGLA